MFSLDGRTLFSGDDLGQIRLWDVATRRLLRSAPSLGGRIEGMAISPDGRSLKVAASTAGMRTLDSASLEWREQASGFLAVFGVAVSRDGRIVAGAEGGGRLRFRIGDDGVPSEKLLSLRRYGSRHRPDVLAR